MKFLVRAVRAASVAAALVVVASGFSVASTHAAHRHAFTTSVIAEQIGVSIASDSAEVEFTVGAELTGTLTDPSRLATFGIADMHKGARVTVTRLSYDKVLIEATESDPPVRKSVKLGVTANGGLRAPTA